MSITLLASLIMAYSLYKKIKKIKLNLNYLNCSLLILSIIFTIASSLFNLFFEKIDIKLFIAFPLLMLQLVYWKIGRQRVEPDTGQHNFQNSN